MPYAARRRGKAIRQKDEQDRASSALPQRQVKVLDNLTGTGELEGRAEERSDPEKAGRGRDARRPMMIRFFICHKILTRIRLVSTVTTPGHGRARDPQT